MNALAGMPVSPAVWERGEDYYLKNRVKYICVAGTSDYEIVEGSEIYEIECAYSSGEIRDLVCTCACSYHCKHEVAAMLQLKKHFQLLKSDMKASIKILDILRR